MMISNLQLINLEKSAPHMSGEGHDFFTLSTCQRKLLIGLNDNPLNSIHDQKGKYQTYNGESAYSFLVETLCGLKSKMLAENEIVAQFKQAFKNYLEHGHANSYLITILEKALKDTKHIRTQYLKNIGQLSYAGITKKIIQNKNLSGPIIILGSGALALDLIKLLDRRHALTLCARNQSVSLEIQQKYNIDLMHWEQQDKLKAAPLIINTIGADNVLFNTDFFKQWSAVDIQKRLFIDLGSPSVIETPLNQENGIIRLEDILTLAKTWGVKKSNSVQLALDAINDKTISRIHNESLNFPFGWEELHFA